jgi:stearoyl-CoA desaturase (delta-9 desaturase)
MRPIFSQRDYFGRIHWGVPLRKVWFVLLHLLFASSWFLAESDLFGSLLVWFLLQFAIHAGYHRYFSHRSFKAHPWFEFLLAVTGCLAVQNGPLWWASTHRQHHRRADTDEDPHSPRHGFWHAHIGWIFQEVWYRIHWDLIPVLCRPIPVWAERHQDHIRLLYILGVLLLFGWPGILTYWIVPVVLCWHTSFATNSFTHSFGSQPYACPPHGSCAARNNPIVGILNLGEGWHNNHHSYPSYAHHGFYKWYQLDLAYVVLFMLEKLGIVWDVKKRTQSPEEFWSTPLGLRLGAA